MLAYFLWEAVVGQVVDVRETGYANNSAQAPFRMDTLGPNDRYLKA